MKNTYYIEIWSDYYNRDQGYKDTERVKNMTLDEVKEYVEDYYNDFIRRAGGSAEIVNDKGNTLFHISVDSDHLFKEVVYSNS